MVKLVLFDIDGTLIRTGGAGVRAFEKTFQTEFGLRNPIDGLSFSGRTDVSLVREAFRNHNVPASEENFRRFFDHYPKWLEHYLRELEGGVCEGVLEFIAKLQRLENAPTLGLLTGNVRRGAELKLRHYKLWQLFKFGAFADDHEERDLIAAAAHQRGCEHHNTTLDGGEIVVIGDTPLDVACGKAINARVLAVATGHYSVDELSKTGPDWAVKDLNEIEPAVVCGPMKAVYE